MRRLKASHTSAAITALVVLLCLASGHASAADKYQIEPLNIKVWLPAQPAPDSSEEAADVARFWQTRSLIAQDRGLEAAQDDVYDPQPIWDRFADAAGVTAGVQIKDRAPHFLQMIEKAQVNGSDLLDPIKLPIDQGGRKRPFIVFDGAPTCLEPVDLVPGHKESDYKFNLKTSGSYPSGHAFRGMLWGLLLSELVPEHADLILKKGVSFGESRVVCGFHYESDVVAGRLAAAALIASLHGNKAFRDDLAAARVEIRALLH